MQIPVEDHGQWDVYYTYTIQADRRDELKEYLESRGVETKIQHPILMPQQSAYRENLRGEFANAKKLVKRILCIPANEKLTRPEIEYVAGCIRVFYKR